MLAIVLAVGLVVDDASVYAPIAFIQGALGKLFVEFSVALAGAVIVSGFVALTLSSMLSMPKL
jgi:multidrug efflux pump